MDFESPWQPNSANQYLAPLDEYKETVFRLFPALPRRVMNNCSIFPVDALALGYFLEHYPRKVVALEIGAFVGASAFFLASHPKVSKVVSVDPNPIISEELTANSDTWVGRVNFEPLEDLKVLDIARTVLEEFREEREKIEFREGVVGSTQVGAKGQTIAGLEKVEVPAVDSSEEEGLVALVDGLHTRKGVKADLEAIFEKNPHAVALLDDCRHGWGALVQAGAVDFMEQTNEEYHFRLIADLGPGLATSNLGIVFHNSAATETRRTLNEVREMFSQRLDPLLLLRRETELIEAVNRTNQSLEGLRRNNKQLRGNKNQEIKELREDRDQKLKEVRRDRNQKLKELREDRNQKVKELRKNQSQLESQVSELKEHNVQLDNNNSQIRAHHNQLAAHYSSRRYKFADAFVGTALQIPGLKSLLRR